METEWCRFSQKMQYIKYTETEYNIANSLLILTNQIADILFGSDKLKFNQLDFSLRYPNNDKII